MILNRCFNQNITSSLTDRLVRRGICIIGIALIAFAIYYAPIIFTDASGATHVLTINNYSDITITGFRPLALGRGGITATGFRAKAPNGQYVTGVVTSAPFQGATIRIGY